MTEHTPDSLESQIIQSLQQMHKRYQRMDALTQQMILKQNEGSQFQDEMVQLKREREELDNLQTQINPLNEAYRSSRESTSPVVKSLTDQTAALIQKLLQTISKLESSAKESYRRLIPEIDQNVRGNQMKQAYGKSS